MVAGGKNLDEVKIQRDIFQRDVLSPLLFALMIIANSGNALADSNFINHKKKINHLIYIDDIKLFTKNKNKN